MFIPRKILKDTNIKKLRQKSKPVVFPLQEDTIALCEYMIEHLRISQNESLNAEYKLRSGVGLAACQLGELKTIFAMHIKYEDGLTEHVFINPKVIAYSLKKAYMQNGEGCLSVDTDKEGFVLRNYTITISGYDYLTKSEVVKKFRGYEAIVVQHELDHFKGILYYDLIDKKNPQKKPSEEHIAI